MRHTVILGWPAELMNLNDRDHYQKKGRLTKAWRQHAHRMFADLAADNEPFARARVVVYYRFPDNRRRDVGNLRPTSKAIVDGIVDSGFLDGDDDSRFVGPDERREYPNGPPRISVVIYELAEADDAA